ncbi:hypothetical protein Tco_0988142 [Tanacetum coccineum]|uniref:Uncharacterized protein n=1 Tax=Tanacetum coccineum TaxID=301880 RepID=A0ABQ5EQU9_9ASTR
MLAICATDTPVVFKAPKPSSNVEKVPQGTKPGAKRGHKKHSTLKQSSMSSKEATKGGSSKAPTGSKTGHSKKRKESSSAMDSNLIQPPASTPIDTGMHKEDHQATGGRTSLGVTSEERANPQLSSGMSAFNLNKPIYSTSFIIHSKSALGNDASSVSTAEADHGNLAPSDFIPQQQVMNERIKNTSYDHLFEGTDPHVLADQTKSVSEGLETVLTQPITGKGASSIARQVEEEEASSTIKLKDLAKRFVVDESNEDEEDEVHHTPNVETEDTSSQKHKLELEKNKVEAEAALLKAQPTYPNMEQLNELLVNSLKIEFSKILSAHDFSSSLPTELKDIPSKFNELTEETLQRLSQVAELKTLQWELPAKFLSLPAQVASVQAKLNTLDALSSLLLNVTKALKRFAQVLDSTSSKARDQSIPLVGQADTMPVEGEKNTNQATISQVFQRRAEKNAEKDMNKQQPKPTTPPATTIIPPIITTTTTRMQTPPQNPQKGSSQPEGWHIKEDKGKKALSSKESKKDSTGRDFNDETHVTGSMVEPSRTKKLKKFDFITDDGRQSI